MELKYQIVVLYDSADITLMLHSLICARQNLIFNQIREYYSDQKEGRHSIQCFRSILVSWKNIKRK